MILQRELFNETNYRAKDRDKELVFREIYWGNGISQKELLDKHKIHPNALSTAVRELREDGLIYEAERRTRGRQGRPEIMFAANKTKLVAFAILVETLEHHAAILDLSGNILFETVHHLPKSAKNRDLEHLYDRLLNQLTAAVPESAKVVGCGISLVGNVHSSKLLWVESERWPSIKEFTFRPLAQKHNLEIRVGRDLDHALANELHEHPEYSYGGTLLLHWGAGIGFAYANEGRILHSRFGRFGTIGHSFVNVGPDGEPQADFEDYASVRAVIASIGEGGNNLTEDEREFANYLRTFSCDAESLNRAVGYMCICLLNILVLFYPERILFLGPFAEQPRILRELETRVRGTALEHPINLTTEFIPIHGGYRGCLFGSTYQLFRRQLRGYLVARG